jgi:1-acyl-sn-glycerol-3-phosphate acyltransferase
VIRTVWTVMVAVPLTVLYGSEVVASQLLNLRAFEHRCQDRPRRWAKAIVRAAGVRVVMEGLENLGRDRAQILVANHQSWFDVLVLAGHLPVEYRFVAKKELTRIPFFGPAWQACGHVAIDRQDRASAIESLEEAGRKVQTEGSTMIIFPEGTRSRDGALQPFKRGAFALAIRSGLPIVPTAILGSGAVMPKGSFRVRSGTIRVRFGDPILAEGWTYSDRAEFTAAVRTAVTRLIEES